MRDVWAQTCYPYHRSTRLIDQFDTYFHQVRRLSDQQGASQAEASVTKRRLEKAETDLVVVRVELGAERSVRERANGTVGTLRRKMAEEKAGLEEVKLQLALVRAARRRSESQASIKTKSMVRLTLRCCRCGSRVWATVGEGVLWRERYCATTGGVIAQPSPGVA